MPTEMRMRLIGLAVVLAVSLLVGSLAEAQRVPAVGVLVLGTERLSFAERGVHELRDALRGFGWIEGQSITLKPRFADLSAERLAALAQELVDQRVDVIVSIGTPATAAAQRATTSIPIVMSAAADPISAGFVSNLSRPDGNVTGTSLLLTETAGKRLQLLKDVTPRLTRSAVLHSGGRVSSQLDELRGATPRLGIELQDFVYRGLDALPAQFAQMRAGRAESLVVVAAQPIDEARAPLAQLAVKHRLPTVFTFREYVEAGGLMSYGPNLRAFQLLKTAKKLGLTIPQSVLGRADQVIE